MRRSLVIPGISGRILGDFTSGVAFWRVLLAGARFLLGGRDGYVKLRTAPSLSVT